MKIYILTEGGAGIGFGHIARCGAIYDAFKKRNIIPEIFINGDHTIKSLIKGKKYRIFNWLQNQNRLFRTIKGADVVIIDSYLASSYLYKKISTLTKIPVYIDDMNRIKYPKGVVINGSAYAEEIRYSNKKGIDYLLGTFYMPLQKPFWNVAQKKIQKDIKKILVIFGGNVLDRAVFNVLKVLVAEYPKLSKLIVMGKNIKNAKMIESLKDSKTKFVLGAPSKKIKNMMLESDIAVSAGGQTLYELARTGVPTIAIAVAENQLGNIRGLTKTHFIKYAGWYDDKSMPAKLSHYLNEMLSYGLRKKMSDLGRKYTDGKGAINIVAYVLNR